jgi:hypothetical protein
MQNHARKAATRLSVTLTLLSIGAGIAAVWLRILQSPHTIRLGRYSFWGWFIDYDGGFVRRGLGGEIVRLFSHGRSAVPVVNGIVFAQYAALACLTAALLMVSPRAGNAVRLLTLAAPFGLIAMARTGTLLGDKEMWFHVCLGAGALWYLAFESEPEGSERARKRARMNARWALVVFCFLTGLVLPLIHEEFVCLAAPAFLILLRAVTVRIGQRATRVTTFAFVAIQLALFGVLSFFHGTPQIAERIWAGVSPADRALSQVSKIPAAIRFLGWNADRLQGLVVPVPGSGFARYWVLPIVECVIFIVAVAVVAARDTSTRSENLSAWLGAFGFLAAASTPLYYMGNDWYRWIAATAMSWLILFLAMTPREMRGAVPVPLPESLASRAAAWFVRPYDYRKPLVVLAVLLAMLAPVGAGYGIRPFRYEIGRILAVLRLR